MIKKSQSRILYSFLKPVVSLATRFGISMRHLSELLRLSYFEHLKSKGFTQKEIADRISQSERHVRLLSSKLKSDFFTPEQEIGLSRRIEDLISVKVMTKKMLLKAIPNFSESEIEKNIHRLISENRIELNKGYYCITKNYSVLASDTFNKRIDALNHFLEGSEKAVLQRLIFDEKENAKVKTISFISKPKDLALALDEIEAFIRIKISKLEEAAEIDCETKDNPTGRFIVTFTSAKDLNTPPF